MPRANALRSASIALVVSAAAGAAIIAGSIAAANAGERHRDLIYADSFGNLVVYSRAGYKRIVVGKGHLAAELNEYASGGESEPNVVRLNDGDRTYVECYRPPALIKGRSYMYGLADGEIPEPSGSCFDR